MKWLRAVWAAVRVRKGAKLPISTPDLLPRFIKRKDLQRIALAIPDRRHLFEAVAKALNVSETDLMQALAQQAGLPFVERPLPIDIAVIKAPLTIRDFRRAGAIAISSGDSLSGVVCIDPAALIQLGAVLATIPVYIGSWNAIAKALDESERIAVMRTEQRAHEEKQRRRKTIEGVLEHILQESRRHGAKEVTIHCTDCPRYQFQSEDGRHAQGTIAGGIAGALRTILEELAGAKEEWAGARIESDLVAGAFRISWGASSPGQLYVVGREEEPELKKPRKARPLVLVVDDNSTFAKVLERFLARHGIEVTYAENVAAAELALAHRRQPDLVVCDLHMPGPGGADLLDSVRQRPATVDLPFVMLTSDDDVETEVRLLGKGADAFVVKNQDPRILCAHVQRLLERAGRRGKVAA